MFNTINFIKICTAKSVNILLALKHQTCFQRFGSWKSARDHKGGPGKNETLLTLKHYSVCVCVWQRMDTTLSSMQEKVNLGQCPLPLFTCLHVKPNVSELMFAGKSTLHTIKFFLWNLNSNKLLFFCPFISPSWNKLYTAVEARIKSEMSAFESIGADRESIWCSMVAPAKHICLDLYSLRQICKACSSSALLLLIYHEGSKNSSIHCSKTVF